MLKLSMLADDDLLGGRIVEISNVPFRVTNEDRLLHVGSKH
jgi:hypothetical protein